MTAASVAAAAKAAKTDQLAASAAAAGGRRASLHQWHQQWKTFLSNRGKSRLAAKMSRSFKEDSDEDEGDPETKTVEIKRENLVDEEDEEKVRLRKKRSILRQTRLMHVSTKFANGLAL